MSTKLTWKRNILNGLYTIYDNGLQIGQLKERPFQETSTGEINGKVYTFITKGFFKRETMIFESSNNEAIGKITYNEWRNRANITINNNTAEWKYENILNTKWQIFDAEGIKIEYSGLSLGGEINSVVNDELLLLSGLFVTNFFRQTTLIVIIIIFVIIIPNTFL